MKDPVRFGYLGTCQSCGKRGYTSRRHARKAAKRLHPQERMHAYQCTGMWHYGHDRTWRIREGITA